VHKLALSDIDMMIGDSTHGRRRDERDLKQKCLKPLNLHTNRPSKPQISAHLRALQAAFGKKAVRTSRREEREVRPITQSAKAASYDKNL
jgi:hypothetical protein